MSSETDARRGVCAVVPAAGRGSRLGSDTPKVFVPLLPELTIWDAIRGKLLEVSDHLVLILSPGGQEFLSGRPVEFPSGAFQHTEITVQERPRGMGDAIFGASDSWKNYENLLIVWGDQFNLSRKTLRACVELHFRHGQTGLTLPLVRAAEPYVEYVFDKAERLVAINQSRESEVCAPGGLSDVGVFLLRGGEVLIREWDRYEAGKAAGSNTGEVNFLPFLVHLSSVAGWPVARYETDDPTEAIGINTPEDLAFARQLLLKQAEKNRQAQ